jgi:hypothetical protein
MKRRLAVAPSKAPTSALISDFNDGVTPFPANDNSGFGEGDCPDA